MKKIVITLSLIASVGTVQADNQAVTVILNSGSTMTQGIALVLTNQMQAQGGRVHVLLCDKAGDLALKYNAGEKLKPQDVSPGQLLDSAIKKGASASVCALYLPNTGFSAEQLKEGIKAARPDAMGRETLEAERKVLVF
ncbi:MAG: hypothetical protein ABTS22_03805 [Accumulibacter sp.]|uniref:hypothetical protein n=1 Tax=Accumulibacter sp. TaxID=2053492 RepID=UPI0033151E14